VGTKGRRIRPKVECEGVESTGRERIVILVRMKINDDRYHMTTAATFGSRIGPMLIFTAIFSA
jgi:hypothetical protein